MKLTPLVIALLVVAVGVAPARQPQRETGDEPDAATYEQLLAQLKGGDTTVDYAALRFSFASTKAYSPFGNAPSEQIEAMSTALEKEKYAKSLRLARALLDDFYLSPDAHLVAAISLEELGNSDEAKFHRAIVRGLFDSICPGNDGKTAESPCRVISVGEEYFFLRLAGLEAGMQNLTTCKYGPCDEMSVRDPKTGAEFTLYFDLSIYAKAMMQIFGGDE